MPIVIQTHLAGLALLLAGCGSENSANPQGQAGAGGGAPPTTAGSTYGEVHSGQFHLGPVDFAETDWPNACAPEGGYISSLRDSTGLGGEYLAGVSNSFNAGGAVCDACILINTGTGRSIVARVVTYGVTNQPGDIDVSPSVYASLNTGEYPRSMNWQYSKCPDTGSLRYEFQTGSNIWWTSLWVRNPRLPVTKVEVKSKNHSNFIPMARGGDGTLTDASGFGEGEFTLRLTAIDGQIVTDTFPSFTPGQMVFSSNQFQ
jgi:expansin